MVEFFNPPLKFLLRHILKSHQNIDKLDRKMTSDKYINENLLPAFRTAQYLKQLLMVITITITIQNQLLQAINE